MTKPLLKLLSQDKNVVSYRPHIATLIGSVTATILFQQITYWHEKQGGKFYKYKEPCKANDYKPGDSWVENLAFSRAEFDTALKRIGTKVRKGDKKAPLFKVTSINLETDDVPKVLKNLVIYWTESDRRTYYQLNEELAESVIYASVLAHEQRNAEYQLKRESDFSKSEKVALPVKQESDFTLFTETTKRLPEIFASKIDAGESSPPKPSGDEAKDNAYELSKVIPELMDIHYLREWNIAHMLSGTSKKGVYKDHAEYFKGDNMVSPEELKKVVAYYKREMPDAPMMRSPEVVADWVGKYRAKMDKKVNTPKITHEMLRDMYDNSDLPTNLEGRIWSR